jgi:hypothetical protein
LQARHAGRPQQPVDPGGGPVQQLALALRKLREDSGNPPYHVMATQAHYSRSALARAASGAALPSRNLVLAYVRGCGGDQAEWDQRWAAAAAQAGHDGNLEYADRQDQGTVQAGYDGEPEHAGWQGPQARAGSAVEGKRHPGPRPHVRLGLAPVILATAAIIAYAIARAASPGPPHLQTQPPASGPAGPSARPSQAQPALGPQPPGTAPATVVSPPAATPSQEQPATSAAVPQAGGGPASRAPLTRGAQVRFDFEQPGQLWFVFWGKQAATGGITTDVAYRGTHSYLVTVNGATASRGASAIGIAHGLAGLIPGMHVTVHLWSSDPGNTAVRFFAMNSQSSVAWAPENPGGDIPLPPGPGWSAMTWTIPAVDQVHAIGIDVDSGTSAPLRVAIDDVSW